MTTNILNLASYRVLRVEETEHDYHVFAEAVQSVFFCPTCNSSQVVGFGRREQMVRDLPTHGRRVGIYIDTRRFKCRDCSRTFYEPLPEADSRRLMTSRLVRWVGQQSLKRTFAGVAEEVGITEGTVRLVFKDFVAELEKTVRFETPQWMGIDEIHLIRPRCVISNIHERTIVDMLVNRDKKTVINYLYNLPSKNQVRYVAMDMWVPYRDACQAVIPDAQIVVDKFHVVRMANDAMERIRKGMREQLTTKQRRGLMHDRFVLLKRERELTDKDRLLLDGWTANYPELAAAYRAKEDFFGIYDAKTPADAMARYEAWNKGIPTEVRAEFSDLIRAWTNWQPWIVNYFNHQVTNAYTESLNNLIRVMNRLGRGYSFEALRAKILFTEGMHKRQMVRPKFVRRDMKAMEGLMTRSWGLSTGTVMNYGTFEEEEEKNFGTDISTLAERLEAGEL
jgi:transposase